MGFGGFGVFKFHGQFFNFMLEFDDPTLIFWNQFFLIRVNLRQNVMKYRNFLNHFSILVLQVRESFMKAIKALIAFSEMLLQWLTF